MPPTNTHHFELNILLQELDSGDFLGEALLFPEISRLDDSTTRVKAALGASVREIAKGTPLLELHRRHAASRPDVARIRITVEPPRRSVAWERPVELTFHLLRWDHGEEAALAYVPALGIEVYGRDAEDLDDRIPKEIHAALHRAGVLHSLRDLVRLQRCQQLSCSILSVAAKIPTPLQREKARRQEKPQESILGQVGQDLTKASLPGAYEIDKLVQRIADALTGPRSASVLLVGASGVGKTAAFWELVRRRSDFKLTQTPFWATSGSRLVAGMSGFGMWQDRCQKLITDAAKAGAILHLGNLVELMEVGKGERITQGIASFLKPYLLRGDVLAVAECTREQLPMLERQDPKLLQVFHQIPIEEPSRETGLAILYSYAAQWTEHHNIEVEPEALETLDRLHRRHVAYSAYPGRPLRFLENLLMDRAQAGEDRISPTDVTEAFASETGLPRFMLDDTIKLDLAQARAWFASRLIGQDLAVNLVVDLLATAKTGLDRPGKPLASLLFIGPTGVGKTELAKVLAEYLFGSRERMTRFDMSEYADLLAVERLTGGMDRSEGLLTAKVREQPFSVILLDELEKAHPLLFDLLLQVLGEARLTDAWGRVADFSNAVVVMTSNLGSHLFQKQRVGFGDGDGHGEALARVLNEVRGFFRPELVNRIDRIVPFGPLEPDALLAISRRQLEQIKRRDGVLDRGLELCIPDEVAQYLARKGHDPRYGARPLRRRIEREILAPLAAAINRYKPSFSLAGEVELQQEHLNVELVACPGQRQEAGLYGDKRTIKAVQEVSNFRRFAQLVRRGGSIFRLRTDIIRLERIADRVQTSRQKGRKTPPSQLAAPSRLLALREVRDELDRAWEAICSLEDSTLLDLYGSPDADPRPTLFELVEIATAWDEALISLVRLRFSNPDQITLAIYSEDSKALFELAAAYHMLLSQKEDTEVEVLTWNLKRSGAKKSGVVEREVVAEPDAFFAQPSEDILGVAFGIRGRAAFIRFELEQGLHRVQFDEESSACLVHCSEAMGDSYEPPIRIDRRGSIGKQPARRLIDLSNKIIVDRLLKERFRIKGHKVHVVLDEIIQKTLMKRIYEEVIQ